MKPPRVWKPSEASQREIALGTARGLRWLVDNDLDFTTVQQDDVHKMGRQMVREGHSGGRVAYIQSLVLQVAQWCVWTARRTALRVDTVHYRVKRGDYFVEGDRAIVLVKHKAPKVRFIDEATQARIILLILDIAKRIGIRMLFQGCRGTEGAGVKLVHALAMSPTSSGHKAIAVLGKGQKWRDVEVDQTLIDEIDLYRRIERPRRLALFKRLNRNAPEPTALLLNAKNGNPITYTVLRRAFKQAAGVLGLERYKMHWSRHAFAANWLAANTILQIRRSIAGGQVLTELLLSTVMEQLRPELAELLGHSSFETTKLYLSRAREAVLAHLGAYPERAARLGYA
jgi:integrase